MNAASRLLKWADVNFLEVLPDDTLEGGALKARKAEHHAVSAAMAEPQRRAYLEMARRWYAEQDGTKSSITSRASSLMLFVGVISTGATLVVSSVSTPVEILRWLVVAVGAALLFACVAIAFGAVRAQGVRRYTAPFLSPEAAAAAGTALDVEEAAEYAVALEQNKKILANLVAYLDYAHKWARRAVVLIALLASLALAAAVVKPAAGAASPASDAAPAAPTSPVPTPPWVH